MFLEKSVVILVSGMVILLQILTLIEVLRNSLEVKNAQLPSLFAVFAAEVARLFLYPGTAEKQ